MVVLAIRIANTVRNNVPEITLLKIMTILTVKQATATGQKSQRNGLKRQKELEVNVMDKLKIVVVPEKNIVASMSGCGRNWDNLCGSRDCVGGRRAG